MLRNVCCAGVAAVWMFVGCGGPADHPNVVPVTGTVLYNGDPVEGAGVLFTPSEGRPASGQTNAQGRFTLSTFGNADGAIPGEHAVTITKVESKKVTVDPGKPAGATGEKGEPPKQLLPKKYGNAKTPLLKATVKADGENDFKFELTD